MTASIYCTNKSRFVILVITAFLLLSDCSSDFLKISAQEATGGNGAGLSEYQGE
jgi:hypothetical protein